MPRGSQRPFDIDLALRRIRKAIRPYPKAAMFALHDEGFGSVFEQLVACIISIRTRDEATVVIARRLFARARDAATLAHLSRAELDELISPSTFHRAKAASLLKIAGEAISRWAGELPCDYDALVSLPGVGPKCANLTLGVACRRPAIAVDIHVHRITRRWGYVRAPTPERTLEELTRVLPRRHWIALNELLVPFGKHICTGALPRCSSCPVLELCAQIGVTRHR